MEDIKSIEKPERATTSNEKQRKAAKSCEEQQKATTDIGAKKTKTGNKKPKQATKDTKVQMETRLNRDQIISLSTFGDFKGAQLHPETDNLLSVLAILDSTGQRNVSIFRPVGTLIQFSSFIKPPVLNTVILTSTYLRMPFK